MHSTTYFPKCLWPLKPMPYKSDLFSFKTDAAWVTADSVSRISASVWGGLWVAVLFQMQANASSLKKTKTKNRCYENRVFT